jgi:ComF family protein
VIHRFKYDGLFALARPLADMMALAWPTWQMPADLVLPIPLHPRRQRRRGFNQSFLLVDELQTRLDWNCRPGAIQRYRYTSPQTNLARDERLENVRGAFRADPVLVEGKRILLIDDVYTTGSTLSAAAEALLEAGAHSVSAYCLSVAVQSSDI